VTTVTTMRIDIWSDLICPWCYLGKRRMEKALDRLDAHADVDVYWRSYRLNPELPREPTIAMVDYMCKRYHIDKERSAVGLERLGQLAATEGLEYRLDRMRPTDTLDAHRLLHLAADRGVADALKERMLPAVLGEGAVIADHATLEKLAGGVGIDAREVREVLASDAYRDAVEADEADGRRHYLDAVPFFLFGGTDRVTSARTVEDYARTLRRVLDR
jgi:predicted DsbA family dithiol-disulfide isomerase